MRLAVVLDRTALTAFGRANGVDGLAVGELIAVVAEEPGAIVGIPAGAYEPAFFELDEDGQVLLGTLARNPVGAVELLGLPGADADRAATFSVEMGQPGSGHVLIEAGRHGAMVATFVPAVYYKMGLTDDMVIDLTP